MEQVLRETVCSVPGIPDCSQMFWWFKLWRQPERSGVISLNCPWQPQYQLFRNPLLLLGSKSQVAIYWTAQDFCYLNLVASKIHTGVAVRKVLTDSVPAQVQICALCWMTSSPITADLENWVPESSEIFKFLKFAKNFINLLPPSECPKQFTWEMDNYQTTQIMNDQARLPHSETNRAFLSLVFPEQKPGRMPWV